MKKEFVNNIFQNIADKYDLMNDLMSFGLHKKWKKEFIEFIDLKNKNNTILDIGCGTGDIALQILDKKNIVNGKIKMFLTDPNIKMINQGIKKLDKKKITWFTSYAENLPIKNEQFDLVTMSFSLRNVENINKTLKEVKRVLKKNGQFLCLEFGKVDNLILNSIYKKYSENFIPILGQTVTGKKDSYEYLINSIKKFPSQNKLTKILKSKNFYDVKYKNLTFGVVAIYSCKKQ
tara:strand:- start:71 stop:769 length:699 start_codon:yes stop_codon:yes gene_type:complete